MRVQIWDSNLSQYLLGTYRYDKESGHVTRKVWEGKGPKTASPLGTVSVQGDMLMVVHFGGKAYTIRMIKLAVFLETGLQYHKVEARDGNRTNLKWENIIPLGQPIASQEEFEEQQLALTEERLSKHKELKAALEAEKDAKHAERMAQLSVAKAPRKTKVEMAVEERDRKDAENVRLGQVNGLRVARWEKAKDEHTEMVSRHPRHLAEKELKERVRARWMEIRCKWGIYTGIHPLHLEMFLLDCNRELGHESVEELFARMKPLEEYTDKVEHDRMWANRVYRGWKVRGLYTYEQFTVVLSTYKWKGEVVLGEYDTMPVELQEQLASGLERIAQEHPPVPEFVPPADELATLPTEEGVQAAVEARAELLIERRAGREVGEQSIETL